MTPLRAAGVAGAALAMGLAIGLVSGASESDGSQAGLDAASTPPVTTSPTSSTTSTTTSTMSTTTTTTRLPRNELPLIEGLDAETAGLTTRISASTSDADGTVVLAEVRWGDGESDTIAGPLDQLDLPHRYAEEGDYRVVVVVQDDRQAARVGEVMVAAEAVQMVVVESFTLTARESCDRFSDDAEFVISIQLLDDGQREPISGDPTFFVRRTMKKDDSYQIDLGWEKEIRPGAGSDLVFYLVEADSHAEGKDEELGPWRFNLDWPATGIDDGMIIKGKGCEAELRPVVRVNEPVLSSAEE